MSLINRGFIPPKAKIILQPSPVRHSTAILHNPSEKLALKLKSGTAGISENHTTFGQALTKDLFGLRSWKRSGPNEAPCRRRFHCDFGADKRSCWCRCLEWVSFVFRSDGLGSIKFDSFADDEKRPRPPSVASRSVKSATCSTRNTFITELKVPLAYKNLDLHPMVRHDWCSLNLCGSWTETLFAVLFPTAEIPQFSLCL